MNQQNIKHCLEHSEDGEKCSECGDDYFLSMDKTECTYVCLSGTMPNSLHECGKCTFDPACRRCSDDFSVCVECKPYWHMGSKNCNVLMMEDNLVVITSITVAIIVVGLSFTCFAKKFNYNRKRAENVINVNSRSENLVPTTELQFDDVEVIEIAENQVSE